MELNKKGDSCQVDYSKALEQTGEIQISLSWSNNNGFMKRLMGHGSLDLDLGCYYEMENGDKLLIDALQFTNDYGDRDKVSKQGSYTQPPYIWHTGDDRGSGRESIETLIINPAGLDQLRHIIVYAFVYDGQARWLEAESALHIAVPGAEGVSIKLDTSGKERMCAIASIDVNTETHTLTVTNLSTFHVGHAACDRAYSWGFTYHK